MLQTCAMPTTSCCDISAHPVDQSQPGSAGSQQQLGIAFQGSTVIRTRRKPVYVARGALSLLFLVSCLLVEIKELFIYATLIRHGFPFTLYSIKKRANDL